MQFEERSCFVMYAYSIVAAVLQIWMQTCNNEKAFSVLAMFFRLHAQNAVFLICKWNQLRSNKNCLLDGIVWLSSRSSIITRGKYLNRWYLPCYISNESSILWGRMGYTSTCIKWWGILHQYGCVEGMHPSQKRLQYRMITAFIIYFSCAIKYR